MPVSKTYGRTPVENLQTSPPSTPPPKAAQSRLTFSTGGFGIVSRVKFPLIFLIILLLPLLLLVILILSGSALSPFLLCRQLVLLLKSTTPACKPARKLPPPGDPQNSSIGLGFFLWRLHSVAVVLFRIEFGLPSFSLEVVEERLLLLPFHVEHVVLLLEHLLPLLRGHRLLAVGFWQILLGLHQVFPRLEKRLNGALRPQLLHHLFNIREVAPCAAHVHGH